MLQSDNPPLDDSNIANGEQAAPSGEASIGACERRRLRKLQHYEEKQAQVQEKKREKRLRQKQRKQETRRELLESMDPEARAAFIEGERDAGRTKKSESLAHLQHAFDSGRPRVVINCSFTATMDYKEKRSLAKQAQLTYVTLRDSASPIQLHLASLDDGNSEVMQCLDRLGFQSWVIHWHKESCWDVFATERTAGKLVVLSPDAEEDLEDVEEDCVYVIGGLVDRSVSKMQTVNQARNIGVDRLRRLPIRKYGPSGAQPVLNIDIVVRILAERLKRGSQSSWPDILTDCLPYRKTGQPTARMRRKQRRQQRAAGTAVDGATPGEGADDNSDEGSSSSSSEAGSGTHSGPE